MNNIPKNRTILNDDRKLINEFSREAMNDTQTAVNTKMKQPSKVEYFLIMINYTGYKTMFTIYVFISLTNVLTTTVGTNLSDRVSTVEKEVKKKDFFAKQNVAPTIMFLRIDKEACSLIIAMEQGGGPGSKKNRSEVEKKKYMCITLPSLAHEYIPCIRRQLVSQLRLYNGPFYLNTNLRFPKIK